MIEPLLAKLDSQYEQLLQLEELLSRELSSITDRKLADISTISAEKATSLDQIQLNDKEISLMAHKLGDEWHSSPEIAEQRQKIAVKLEQLQKMNEVNGKVIQSSQMMLKQFKDLVLSSVGKKTLTYGQDGKTSGNSSTLGIKA